MLFACLCLSLRRAESFGLGRGLCHSTSFCVRPFVCLSMISSRELDNSFFFMFFFCGIQRLDNLFGGSATVKKDEVDFKSVKESEEDSVCAQLRGSCIF